MLVIAQKGSDCLETLCFIGLQSNVSRTPRQGCKEIPTPDRKVRLPLDLGQQELGRCLGRRLLRSPRRLAQASASKDDLEQCNLIAMTQIIVHDLIADWRCHLTMMRQTSRPDCPAGL